MYLGYALSYGAYHHDRRGTGILVLVLIAWCSTMQKSAVKAAKNAKGKAS